MPIYPHKTKKTIPYKGAPSGYINIEKWVPPFVEVKNGFGFVGVLAEDVDTGKLQCHICGKWYEQLSTHVFAGHNMLPNDYRETFGLFIQTALKSGRLRLIHSKVMIDFRKSGKRKFLRKFKKNNKESANRKGKTKPVESQNSYGNCDLQIMTKIVKLSHKLGKTPTLVDIKKEYGGSMISTMHSRYGSYINYCRNKLHMEPNFSTRNPRFKNKKEWRRHLIDVGKKAVKEGKPMVIKKLLPTNEQRYIYKFFNSFKSYKKLLSK